MTDECIGRLDTFLSTLIEANAAGNADAISVDSEIGQVPRTVHQQAFVEVPRERWRVLAYQFR